MEKFLTEKKILLEKVFEKASKETTEKSFSGISKYIERTLWDDYKIRLTYKTFETYYKTIIEKGKDYNIKSIILDDLSKFLNYNSFKDFCKSLPEELLKNHSDVKITISGEKETSISDKFSSIIINITNSPVFSIPEFISKHSNSFGLIGILLVAGFIFKKNKDYFGIEKKYDLGKDSADFIFKNDKKVEQKNSSVNVLKIYEPQKNNAEPIKLSERKKECMYWNEDHYEEVYCDEIIEGKEIIALNEAKKLLRKITKPDTLTVENALGKVWYSKYKNRVDFFTMDGTNPENDKELHKVTEYIIDKYVQK